jgi:hypothetical protein
MVNCTCTHCKEAIHGRSRIDRTEDIHTARAFGVPRRVTHPPGVAHPTRIADPRPIAETRRVTANAGALTPDR